MKKVLFSKDWQLRVNLAGYFIPVDLPHDFAVTLPRIPNSPGGEYAGGYQGGTGRYLKYWKPEDTAAVFLDIDGSYMHTQIRINGDLFATHHHGYTPILEDLSGRINRGVTNKLDITATDIQPSSRWYSGAGVYRDVFLWYGDKVRIEPRDLFVTTKSIDDNEAVIHLTCIVSSDIDASGECCFEIREGSPKSLSLPPALNKDTRGDVVLTHTADFSIGAGAKTTLELDIPIKDAKLWDAENPNLYTVLATVSVDGKTTDEASTTFGIRTVTADAKRGLLVNGKSVKLRGGCIHHDHGVLGAAEFPAAIYRKLSRLKKVGFNALRMSHNPPSTSLLEICDRLGIYIMDEAFDMWSERMTAADYHLWFPDWYERDLTKMINRDKAHTCVISYSVGNEVTESSGESYGAIWSKILADCVRKLDPTRLVTACTYSVTRWTDDCADPKDYYEAFCAKHVKKDAEGKDIGWQERTAEYYAPFDICGYNYRYKFYEEDAAAFPERVIWGSETHALTFFESWQKVLAYPYVIGDFTWTAWDNMGEAGTGRFAWARDGHIDHISTMPYPWRNCFQGDFFLTGDRRPQSYFREAIWRGSNAELQIFTTHPDHYGEGFSGTLWHWYDVVPSWTFEDQWLGKPVKCEAYTTADEVEWFLNGKLLGTTKPEKAIATIDIPYAKGELKAVAKYSDGTRTEATLKTAGAPTKLLITPETKEILADNRDLCYFDIAITDDNGEVITASKAELTATVTGGELLGIFSGDPANTDEFTSPVCHAYEGRAVAIVRTKEPGEVVISITSPALSEGTAKCTASLKFEV